MSGPWEKYGAGGGTTVADGPWAKYGDQKRSAASPIAPPAFNPSRTPAASSMSKVNLVGGDPVRPLSEALYSQGRGALAGVENVSAPIIGHRIAQRFGKAKEGDLFPEEAQLKDIPGQATAAFVGGLEDHGPAEPARGRTVPEVPRGAPLDAESQAKYTADLDKANADFKSQAQKYHEGTTKAFDEAKREQLEARKQQEAATQKAIDEHKQNVQKYHEELSNTFDKAKRQQLESAAKYEQEYSEWLEKSRDYHKAQAEAEASATKQRQLREQSKTAVKATYDNLQQTYKAARADLDQRWGAWRQGMEGAELDPKVVFDKIEEVKADKLRGSPASLTQFNNLMKEMGVQDFVDEESGIKKAVLGAGELPVETARVHYSALGDKLAQGDLPGNIYHALKDVQAVLDGEIQKAAKVRGLDGEYSSLKANEHQFQSDWVDKGSPLAKAHNALDSNFLEPHVMGRGNDYITKQLERYRKFGAQPDLPLSARRMAETAKEMPTVKVPKEPGPEPQRPTGLPEASSPKLARPATVPEPPGVPEKVPPKSPELKAVERPKPKPPAKGTVGRKLARVGGKIVGGTAGAAVGHPFLGYEIGGGAGTELYDRATRPKTVPPPPDE